MTADTPENDDPIKRDAKTIADAAADLGQARTRELSDGQEEAIIKKQIEDLEARDAVLVADQTTQRAREAADERVIEDANQDAQRRTGAVPGPTAPPQPPRPRVG